MAYSYPPIASWGWHYGYDLFTKIPYSVLEQKNRFPGPGVNNDDADDCNDEFGSEKKTKIFCFQEDILSRSH